MLKNRIKTRFKNAYHTLIAIEFIGEFVLVYPLYSIMFSDRSGISAAGVGFLLAATQIAQIVSEIPTGVLADKFSKKYSIIAGKGLKAACFAIWLVSPSFTGYLIGFLVWGVGEAFTSGATQAYLYELSEGDKSTKRYLKSFSRLKALTMVSYVFAYLTTFLIGPNYPVLLFFSSAAVFVAFALGFTLPDSKPLHNSNSTLIITDAVTRLKSSDILRRRFIEGLVILVTLTTLIEVIVINYRDFGVSLKLMPLIISVVALLNAVLFWLLHYYEKLFSRFIVTLSVLTTATYLLLFNQSLWFQVLGLFIVSRFFRVAAVIQESDLQDELHDNSRATVLSFYSLVAKLFSALQLLLLGIFAINNNITIPTVWMVVSTIIVFMCIHTIYKRQSKT